MDASEMAKLSWKKRVEKYGPDFMKPISAKGGEARKRKAAEQKAAREAK
jgi:hypothetical protein